MNIHEFRTMVTEYVSERLGDEYSLFSNDVIKNNGLLLHGLTIKKSGSNLAPTVYLDSFYTDYEYGKPIERIVEGILASEAFNWSGEGFDCEFFSDYSQVKDKLFVKLINTERNEKLLEDVPSRSFLDLSMVACCDVQAITGVNASILIRKEHIRLWGMDEEAIIDAAYDNTKIRGSLIREIADFIPDVPPDVNNVYVLSNKPSFFGAVCMTFDDVLDEFCEKTSSGYYIIPSSIHEVILVPEDNLGEGASSFNCYVRHVNEQAVELEDILSDHLYYYSPAKGYISV